jgi:hypothetical protein
MLLNGAVTEAGFSLPFNGNYAHVRFVLHFSLNKGSALNNAA